MLCPCSRHAHNVLNANKIQKATFYRLKDRLSGGKKQPFATQYAVGRPPAGFPPQHRTTKTAERAHAARHRTRPARRNNRNPAARHAGALKAAVGKITDFHKYFEKN